MRLSIQRIEQTKRSKSCISRAQLTVKEPNSQLKYRFTALDMLVIKLIYASKLIQLIINYEL